jgi:galactokinase
VGGAEDLGAPASQEERPDGRPRTGARLGLSGRLRRLAAAFQARFGRPPTAVAAAPGRVNLIGEHLDYNEGHVLPVAIDRSVMVAFAPRPDRRVRLYSLDFEQESAFDLEDIQRDPEAPWSDYVRGVAWALRGAGHRLSGLDAALQGDVPVGAGLSSSAALEVAALGAFEAASGLRLDRRDDLALLGQRAENGFVGVACGIMDQMAAALSRAGHALLIDCRSLEYEAVPLPLAGLRLVVADSGVRRALVDSQYNVRGQECQRAAELLAAAIADRPVTALRDVRPEDLAHHGDSLPPSLFKRARHVVEEERRVLLSVEALRAGDVEAFGEMLDASHRSLRDDFEVSCPELDLLVDLARAQPGVLGARLTGAGFGGCTVSLVRAEAVGAFRNRVVERYRTETGREGRMYVCRAAGGLKLHCVG